MKVATDFLCSFSSPFSCVLWFYSCPVTCLRVGVMASNLSFLNFYYNYFCLSISWYHPLAHFRHLINPAINISECMILMLY